MRYLPLTPDDRAAMLAAVGASSIDDLFVDVPAEERLYGPIEGLPAHASELAVKRHMAALSRQSRAAGDGAFFLGAGTYRHHVTESVDQLLQPGELLPAHHTYLPAPPRAKWQQLVEHRHI